MYEGVLSDLWVNLFHQN